MKYFGAMVPQALAEKLKAAGMPVREEWREDLGSDGKRRVRLNVKYWEAMDWILSKRGEEDWFNKMNEEIYGSLL